MIQQVEVLYTSSWINCLNCKVLYIKPFKRGCIPFQLPSLWRVPKITWGLTCWFWTTKRRKNRPSSRSLSPLSTYARRSVSRSCRWRTCTHPRSRSIKFLCLSGPGIWVKKKMTWYRCLTIYNVVKSYRVFLHAWIWQKLNIKEFEKSFKLTKNFQMFDKVIF